ncbi:MAG: helix-turn-helix domain-containing protein [Clostridia bacterium]|nr:helix-turn-helix domain-containing protein [Clostridia bacterium]
MRYEQMRPDDRPYKLWIGAMRCGGEHIHADFEFAYCFVGGFEIDIDRKSYSVNTGDLLLIPPMALHGGAKKSNEELRVLSGILGISFLKNYLPSLRELFFDTPIISLDGADGNLRELRALLDDTVRLCMSPSPTSSLRKTGNLYKIIASLIELTSSQKAPAARRAEELHRIESVERALELIYSRYNTPIDVEEAARAAGCSTSNFCRTFKTIVGESFHKRLNRHRISCALGLLRESSMQISDIAAEVGFPEAKSFCRVFRDIMGMTPGEYRRMP